MRTSKRLLIRKCPYCGHNNNAVSAETDLPEVPGIVPGDLSLCINCGGIATFGPRPRMNMIKTTAEEIASMEEGERVYILTLQRIIRGIEK